MSKLWFSTCKDFEKRMGVKCGTAIATIEQSTNTGSSHHYCYQNFKPLMNKLAVG